MIDGRPIGERCRMAKKSSKPKQKPEDKTSDFKVDLNKVRASKKDKDKDKEGQG
jgi:hypothetical protein